LNSQAVIHIPFPIASNEREQFRMYKEALPSMQGYCGRGRGWGKGLRLEPSRPSRPDPGQTVQWPPLKDSLDVSILYAQTQSTHPSASPPKRKSFFLENSDTFDRFIPMGILHFPILKETTSGVLRAILSSMRYRRLDWYPSFNPPHPPTSKQEKV
jgi:hypothetical protein